MGMNRSQAHMKNGSIHGLLTITFGLLLLTGCGQKGGGPPAEFSVAVAVTKPEKRAVEDLLPAVGTIEPDERVVIQPEVSGLIETIEFAEGHRVKKGEVLFRLRATKEEAQLAQATADLALARANLERAHLLDGTKAISAQEVDQMKSSVEVREATVDLERRRLEEKIIMAPFDGVLGPRQVSVGQYVNAGMPLVTLVEDARVKIEFRVPERRMADLHLGQGGRVRVSALPDRDFEGTVDLVNPEIDPGTRTVEARLLVPNHEGLLRPGMFARVELVVSLREGALVVPESALIPSLDQFSVFLVETNRARLQPVKIGVRLPGKVELREGVTSESTVIISGTQKLVDGVKVKPSADSAPATWGRI